MNSTMSEESICSLHDAELCALSQDAEAGNLQCVFRTVDGRCVTLLLGGVTKFRCTDFGMQNVVFQLVVSDSTHTINPQDVHTYVTWMSATAEGEQLAQPREIQVSIDQVLSGRSRCVFLIPSWGAQLGAIAATVEWQWGKV